MKFTRKIPKKVKNCPILEAIVELRFNPSIDRSAVFGILYKDLKEFYPGEVIKLPILQFPEQLRSTTELRYKPYYRLERGNNICQIGPDNLSIVMGEPYVGWKEFANEIGRAFKVLIKSGIVDSVERLGIRYMNFFAGDIFSETDIEISVANDTIDSSRLTLVINEDLRGYTNKIKIDTTATVSNKYRTSTGTIIDIDTVRNTPINKDYNTIMSYVNNGHNVEKEIFFNLLKDPLIESLEPDYE